LDLTIAVNLSVLDLSDPELVNFVLAQIEANDLAPSKLVLELTESAVMKDESRAAAVFLSW
jgi:EAL domain-containing protein (putative c-di-GMP-specific phosphodiesterase class I)